MMQLGRNRDTLARWTSAAGLLIVLVLVGAVSFSAYAFAKTVITLNRQNSAAISQCARLGAKGVLAPHPGSAPNGPRVVVECRSAGGGA